MLGAKSELEIIVGLTDKTNAALGGINDKLQTMGKIAIGAALGGVVALGAGIIAVASKAIPAASNLNEALNASSVVFGESADTIHDWGQGAADAAGLSAEAFNQMAAQTGAMLTNFGFDTKKAADETINLTQRAADMASIFNTDVSESMVAVQAGLRGETEPLRRFGVSLTQASVEAKALELGFKKVNGQFDTNALTTARLALIYEQTDKIAGDFKNTSDGLANSTRIQQARWQNFLATLGGLVLPIVQKAQKLFMDIASVVLPKVMEILKPLADKFGVVAEKIVNLVEAFMDAGAAGSEFREALGWLIGEDLAGKILDAAAGIQAFIQPIVDNVSKFVTWKDVMIALGIAIATVIVPAVISLVASMLPIILIVGALIGAIALLRNAWENDWGGIRTAITEWWEAVGQPIFTQLVEWLQLAIPAAIKTLSDWWTGTALPAMQTVWNWVKDNVYPIVEWYIQNLQKNIPLAIKFYADMWNNYLHPIIVKVWSWVRDVAFPIIQTLWNWLQTNLPAAIKTISDFWNNTLLPALRAVWNFLSTYIIPIITTVNDIIGTVMKLALETVSNLWNNVLLPALRDAWTYFNNNILPVLKDVWSWIAEKLSPALTDATGFFNTLGTAIKDLAEKALTWVLGKLKDLKDLLDKLKPPDFLTSNSPTPFEMGLRGINDALAELNRGELPRFAANMGAVGNAGNNSTVNNWNLSINSSVPANIVSDFAMMKSLAGV